MKVWPSLRQKATAVFLPLERKDSDDVGILCDNFCSASLSAQETVPMEQRLVRHICPAAILLLDDFLQSKMCFVLTQNDMLARQAD